MWTEPTPDRCKKCGGPMDLLIWSRLDGKKNVIPRCKHCGVQESVREVA